MAEEKKFLDETMEQPKNRKLVAKNIVLAFVVFVILLLCVLAWFSAKNDATASGLSVKTSGESGLEVSLDGGEHWDTKWASREVTGWRKSDILAKYDSTNGGSLMQLLSGNGKDLYYTKSVDANGDVKDSDFVKISDDKAGDYCLEFEAYFRSENQCSVALTNQSKVEPCDGFINENDSSKFSPDYIAGAARVAFLEEDMNDPKQLIKTGLWIPNPLYELTSEAGSETTYEKMPDNFGGNVSTSEGGKPTDTTVESKYYLWTSTLPMDSKLPADQNKLVLDKMHAIPMIPVKNQKDMYYCQFFTVVPETDRYEQLFTINDSNVAHSWEDVTHTQSNTTFIQNVNSEEGLDPLYWNVDRTTDVELFIGANQIDENGIAYEHTNFKFRKIYFNQNTAISQASRLVKFVYNSETKTVTFGNPDKSTVSVTNNKNTQKLEEGATIAVTRSIENKLYGMSSNGLTSIIPDFKQGSTVCDLVVDGVKDDSNGSRSYRLKFLNFNEGVEEIPYLAVVNDTLTRVPEESQASYFYIVSTNNTTTDEKGNKIHEKLLAYIATDSDGNQRIKYVTYDSASVKFGLSDLDSNETGYMIYQKVEKHFTKYGMLTDITNPQGKMEDKYYYFNGTTKAALKPEEYMTSLDDPEKNKALVKLETQETFGDKTYYTGKMKVRIFAEGFDREAKKPMEKGKIKVSLQFIAT